MYAFNLHVADLRSCNGYIPIFDLLHVQVEAQDSSHLQRTLSKGVCKSLTSRPVSLLLQGVIASFLITSQDSHRPQSPLPYHFPWTTSQTFVRPHLPLPPWRPGSPLPRRPAVGLAGLDTTFPHVSQVSICTMLRAEQSC